MSLPDQKYMNHVRDALWSRAERASVMIGSGFSKNAQPARPDAVELPLWHELAGTMFDKLNPVPLSGSQHSARASSSDPKAALRLAQEYKETFGQSGLHLFLQQQIRHGDFNPGEFHRRLLKLPWRIAARQAWPHPNIGWISSSTGHRSLDFEIEKVSGGPDWGVKRASIGGNWQRRRYLARGVLQQEGEFEGEIINHYGPSGEW